MSYTPLKVRYGTAVEPWHTLAPWYRGFGQVDTATVPLVGIAVGLFALALIGGGLAQRHQRTSLTSNKQRKKRSKTRGSRRAYSRARGDDRVEERRFLERLSKALRRVEEMSPEDRYYMGL
jgi:Na+/glutamate symporter